MKKFFLIVMTLILSLSVMAQQRIQFRSADRVECVNSDMTGLRASFSFSGIDASNVQTTRGELSEIHIEGTYPNGNVGEPQLPMFTKLIAIPTGATPVVTVGAHTETEYALSDYGIGTVSAMQAPIRKSVEPSTVEYAFNEAAYARNSYNDDPIAMVEVLGTMRGITLGRLIVQPVRYNPVAGKVKVFNNIEVSVDFQNGDAVSTAQMFANTCSPAFQSVYDQIFNIDMLMGRGTRDAYSDHPDMYNTPVKMLVICYSGFKNNTALNSWLQWKLQKGYYVDIHYTDETGTSASSIKNFITTKYNASVSAGNAYTYLIVIGDTGQVPQYMTKTIDNSIGECASDLGYAAINFSTSSTTNYFPDMYYSRISVENTTHLANYINKVLTYEKYEFTDGGNYLNNVILVGGWDSSWTARVAKPTINYATNYYFNSSNTTYGGFENGTIHATISTSSTQGWSGTNHGCYNGLNDGVCFLNYTAHGDKQEWQGPQFTAKQVEGVTNTGKYFFGVGNCCLTGNYNLNDASYSSNYAPSSSIGATASFGETMIRVPNAGAIAYVGCSPYSYWYEDFYWAVGAHSYSQGNYPTTSASSNGVYDVMFQDQYWNSASALLYVGNLAVQQAVTNGNTNSSVTDGNCRNSAHYYFQFYHTFGDGSIMPYITKPEVNSVSHANTISIGATTFAVSAAAGSYVSITKDNEILGVAVVPSSGTVNVPISGLTSAGDVTIVVTRQQRQPYITTIQAVSTSGPYISLDSYTPNIALIGETTGLSLTFKNVGTTATSGTTTVTLTSNDPTNLTVVTPTKTFNSLAANATTTVSGFQFRINSGAVVGFNYTIHYTATNGNNTWEGDVTVTANQVYTVTVASNNNNYGTVSGGGQYNYGASCTVTATPADGYMFTNWTQNGNVVSTNPEYSFTVSSNVSLVANFAAGVMIGDGSSSSNEYLPTYNYYNYSLTEQIYTSAELGGAGAITSIAFYNEGSVKTRTLDFYLKTTTKSSFSSKTDWITVSSSDKVFSGSVTMVANDWTTITFSSPFVYDGTSNVVLAVDDNTGEYSSSPHMACRVFNATGNQTIYIYSDGTNYNPSSPTTSQSSNYAVLTVKNQIILTKEALSTEPVYITVSANPSQAATVSGGGEYTFGQTCTVTATPNTGYTFTGWTENGTVVSDELSYSFTAIADRDLVANFIQAIEIGTASSTNNYLPTYNYYNYSLTQQIYTAAEIGMAGTINSIAFYNGGAEKTRTLEFYLKTTTKSSFSSSTDWITVSASDKVFSGSVTMTAGAWTYINFTTPFEYDGTSNLVLVVDDNSGAYTSSPHMSCSVFNANGNQSLYYYDDDNNFNPLSPPTSAGTSTKNNVLSVKNHIRMGIEANNASSYDITVSANPADGGTVTGTGTYDTGSTATLVATANEGYTFTNWTRNGVAVSTNATYSFTVNAANSGAYIANFTLNSYTITATAIPAEGGMVTFGARNRDDLFYDFEDGTSQGWTTFQGNTTSPHSWMHITEYSYAYNYSTMSSGHGYNSSDGYMYSESYITGTSSGNGTIVTPDNYLVSPQVRLGGSITFHAGAQNVTYCAEHFSLMVSTTGNNTANNFSTVQTWTFTPTATSGSEWQEFTVDLSAYSGMGYVAIRHFDCSDEWFLCIDDVTIVEGQDPSTGNGNFNYGETCTVMATPNAGYYFVNWTENGNAVSATESYSFTVTADRDLVANFSQQMPSFSITATANPTDGGTVTGGGTFEQGQSCTLTATANEGYAFVNWTEDGEEASTDSIYSFVVTGERNLVANFVASQEGQTVELSEGWSWWSTNLDITLDDLKNAIADAVGNTGTATIKTQGGAITYRNGQWRGNSIQSLDIRRMYEIQTSVTCEITLVGTPVNPSEYEITITPDNNWIGFLSGTSMTLSEAFGTFPVDGDVVTSQNLSSVYRNGQWRGQLSTLQPGHGYIYQSHATGDRTFTFPENAK